jgi:hypothetical protein
VKLATRHRVHCTTAGSEKRSEQAVPPYDARCLHSRQKSLNRFGASAG